MLASLALGLATDMVTLPAVGKEDHPPEVTMLEEMDLEQLGDSSECKKTDVGQIVWSNAMSTFVLAYLSKMVSNGTRISFGFKQVHLNACGKALNEHLGCHVAGNQVGHHLRKWKKIYKKIKKLKSLSAALWDETTCTIRLDPAHYQDYVKDHKEDANFLNTPLEHYNDMATIFDNAMATGKYAKGSSEPLATDIIDLEKGDATDGTANEQGVAIGAATSGNIGGAATSGNIGGQSTSSRPPPKRAKVGADDLGYMLLSSLDELSGDIVMTAAVDTVIPEDLHDNLMTIPGFEEAHLVHYFAYLCDNPSVARAFNGLSLSNKMIWVARYIKNHIPGFLLLALIKTESIVH